MATQPKKIEQLTPAQERMLTNYYAAELRRVED